MSGVDHDARRPDRRRPGRDDARAPRRSRFVRTIIHTAMPAMIIPEAICAEQSWRCPSSARIGHAADEKACRAGDMLDRVEEWAINFYLDWFVRTPRKGLPHLHRSGGSCFGSFFIHRDERLVKHPRNVELVFWLSERETIEVGAARWLIERCPHAERFQLRGERKRRWLELELRQM